MGNQLWASPLQIAIALYMLWGQLGVASLAGVAIMVILMPTNAVIMVKIRKLQKLLMIAKDKRIKLMNAILSGIRVLKVSITIFFFFITMHFQL